MKLFCERVLVSASNRGGTGRIMYQNSVKKRSEKQRDIFCYPAICYARCQAIASQVIQCNVYQKLVKLKVREAAAPGKLVARSATGTP